MTQRSKRVLYWAPRALSILFIAFLGLFALDVFGAGYGFRETLLALTMHLIPNFVLIAVVALAWRWEWTGAALFSIAGVLHAMLMWQRPNPTATKIMTILPMETIVFVLAALWLANWIKRDELRAKR
jgi:lysylphosphatidylglycerol synthetase-like protein (DUF2156 family)